MKIALNRLQLGTLSDETLAAIAEDDGFTESTQRFAHAEINARDSYESDPRTQADREHAQSQDEGLDDYHFNNR